MRTEEEVRAWLRNYSEVSEWIPLDDRVRGFIRGLEWVLNDKDGE